MSFRRIALLISLSKLTLLVPFDCILENPLKTSDRANLRFEVDFVRSESAAYSQSHGPPIARATSTRDTKNPALQYEGSELVSLIPILTIVNQQLEVRPFC